MYDVEMKIKASTITHPVLENNRIGQAGSECNVALAHP
jgi:hypothetical protein